MLIEKIIQIDRQVLGFFNGSDSIYLDGVVTLLTSGLSWIPLYVALFYVVVRNNDTMSRIWITVGCALLCVFLADGLSDGLVKPLIARPRPLNDLLIKHTIDIVAGSSDRQFSFFSAHAANTFSLAVFFSLLIRQRAVTVLLVGWSLLNCWTRLYLGMHYPSDILVGLLWGFVVGGSVYHIFRRHVRTRYTASDADILIVAVALTLLYAVVCPMITLI